MRRSNLKAEIASSGFALLAMTALLLSLRATSGSATVIARKSRIFGTMKQSKLAAMDKQYYVYIMSNVKNNVLYTGIANDLKRRIFEHKEKLLNGFPKKYNIIKLVYYEIFGDSYSAISREKQIKGGSRSKKVFLIESNNPEWKDLYETL